MEVSPTFEKLKTYFETKEVCKEASSSLSGSVEIGFLIDGNTEATFLQRGGRPFFELRKAQNADVVFHISSTAADKLVRLQSEDIGEIGVLIAKEILAGEVKVKVPGSIFNLVTRGYLGVVAKGGMGFSKFLAQHGIQGIGKLKDTIKKMKEDS